MIAENYTPTVVNTTSGNPNIAVTAKLSGQVLTLQVVNISGSSQTPAISLTGYLPTSGNMQVTQLSGGRNDQNNAGNVNQVVPQRFSTSYALSGNVLTYTFPANSFTVLRLR
jgi:alpha-L-arabinofuranosidase